MDAKAKKRILIAKDVLKLLDAKKISPKRGVYINLSDVKVTDEEIPLEKILKSKKSCQACALGSLLYAYVNRFNEVRAGDIAEPDLHIASRDYLSLNPHQGDCTVVLSKYFYYHQLHLIEGCFEGRFGYKQQSLRSIMNNVIKNKGEFIP